MRSGSAAGALLAITGALALGFLAAPSAHAAAAPHLDWRTIHTGCCDIHYPKELEALARRVATLSDQSVAVASAFLDSAPLERVQVVLHDVTDTPNGFTSVVPYDLIDLRATTPESDSELAVTDEYLRLLVQHEMLHVVHLDTIHGVPAVVNLAIGKVWPPNLLQPRFVVEGLATLVETRFTGGGRLTSTAFRSELLIAALAGDLWSLDDVSSYSRRNPGGGAAYAYGAAFIEWLSARYGAHIWAPIAHDYGGSLIPYAVQRAIESETGHDLEEDYRSFLDDVRAEAEALRARAAARGGPSKVLRLTRIGGAVRTPRFLSDGTLVIAVDGPNAPAGLFAIADLPLRAPVLEPIVRTVDAVDVTIVDDEIFFTQSEVTRAWFSFHDLWRATGRGSVERVTRELRVRAPSAIPGTRSVVAEQRSAREAALVIIDVDEHTSRDLVRSREDDGVIWYSPDVAPDARTVAVSRWSPGGARDIVELDLATGVQRTLTLDGAQDLDPAYTLDGAHVLFASDREGTFSIYAVNRSTLEVRRVVDSLGLARMPRPTPDGRGLVYVDTHLEGQDLYAAALDLDRAPVVGAAAPAPVARALSKPSDAVDEPYQPLATLLPRSYLPLLAADATGAPAVGVAVVGEDAAGLFSWAAQGTWSFGIERPRLSASLRFADLTLPLSLSGEWRTERSAAVRRTDGLPDVQQETVLRGAANLQFPYARSRRFAQSIALGYARDLHIVENPLTSPPDARAPVYPPSATIGAVTFDWSTSAVESYRDSVSTERGFSTFLRVRHATRLLLSDQELTEVFIDARAFHPVPGLGGHAIGVYLSGGLGIGEASRRASFALGGFEGRDITRDLLEGTRSGFGVLRGYPRVVLFGDALTMATLEYRLPLLEVEQGLSTLPISFQRIHAAVFTDLGLAFDGVPVPTSMRASVGAELRANLTLGYYGFFFVRAGFARGVSVDGIDQPYLVMGFPY